MCAISRFISFCYIVGVTNTLNQFNVLNKFSRAGTCDVAVDDCCTVVVGGGGIKLGGGGTGLGHRILHRVRTPPLHPHMLLVGIFSRSRTRANMCTHAYIRTYVLKLRNEEGVNKLLRFAAGDLKRGWRRVRIVWCGYHENFHIHESLDSECDAQHCSTTQVRLHQW